MRNSPALVSMIFVFVFTFFNDDGPVFNEAGATKKLKATDGVEEVRVSFPKKEALVKYNDQDFRGETSRVINTIGFKAAAESSAVR